MSAMKALPHIGTKVKYRRTTSWGEVRECIGTVIAHYRGGDRHKDPETGKFYVTPDHASVRVEKPLPAWWPYGNEDRFAPEVRELDIA